MNILKRIILVNSWPNGNRKFRVFDVDGGAILQGGNGVGKTSTLILPLLFFGARPSDVMKASKKKKDKFVSRYLPTDSSYIAFEYVKNNQSKLVIVHSQDGENLHYLFCEAEFSDKLFLDESSNFVKIENLRNHLSITHGVSVFKKRFSVMDYREIIQSAKRLPASHKDYKSINEAKARFSLCENNESIAGSEKVAISIISSKPSFQSIKELIAQEIEIFDIGVQDQLSKETNVKELQKQATVIRQAKGFLKHENSVRQLSIHSRAIKNLEDELAILKFQAVQRLKSQDLNLTQAQSEKDILTKEFVDYEAKHNEVSRQYNEDISQLKGDIKDVENRISVLKDKYQSYQENGIEDKRRKGDAVNDLENELAVLNKQMESLNGSFEKIESLYQRQIDELDKSLARRLKEEENRLSALKDKEIQEQEKIREKMQEFLEILSTSHDENLKKIIDDQTNIKVEIGKLQQIASSPSSPEIKRITKEIDQLNQQLSEKTSLRNSIHEQLMDVYKNRSENDREIDINRGQEDKCHRDLESLHKSIEECNKSLENVDSMLFFKIAKLSAHKANIASRALTIGLLKTPVKEDVQVFDDGDNRLLGIDFDTNHLPPQEILDKSQLENRLSRLEQAKQEQIDTQQKIFRKRKELDQQSHELNQKKNRLEVELGVLKNKIEQINLQTTKSENDLKTEAKIKKEQTKKALQEHEVLLEGLKGKELSLRDDYEATKAKIKDGAQNELTESKNRMADKKAEFDRYKSEQLISHQNELAELEIRKRADLNAEGAPIEAIENCRNAIYKKTEILRDAKEAKEEYEKYSIWFELEYSRLPELEKDLSQSKEYLDKKVREKQSADQKYQEAIDGHKSKLSGLNKTIQSASYEVEVLRQLLSVHLSAVIEKESEDTPPPAEKIQKKIRDGLNNINEHDKEGKVIFRSVMSGLRQYGEIYSICKDLLIAEGLDELDTDKNWRVLSLSLSHLMSGTLETHIETIKNFFFAKSKDLLSLDQKLAETEKRIRSKGKEISRQFNGSGTTFSNIYALEVDIDTSLSRLPFRKSLSKAAKAFNDVRILASHELPNDSYFDIIATAVKDVAEQGSGLDVASFIEVVVRSKNSENEPWRQAVTDEELDGISSEGLSLLILISLYAAIKNVIQKNHSATLLWSIDEIGKLHSDNTSALKEILEKERIQIFAATPEANLKIVEVFNNFYDLKKDGAIHKFDDTKRLLAKDVILNALMDDPTKGGVDA